MEQALRRGDVAGVILEPDGPVVGTVPMDPGYLRQLRDLTRRFDVPLIFDEVVTGFRLAPGGAQEYFGVVPDVTTFAKAIAGGVPSGAVVGRADIMDGMAFRDDPEWDRRGRVRHMGTYSAHPMAAAVGTAALDLLRDGSVQDYTAELATELRHGLNTAMRDAGVAGCAYGLRSCFRFIVGDPDDVPDARDPEEFLAAIPASRLLAGTQPHLRETLQRAFFLEGVDILAGNHGWLSQAHTARDVQMSVEAFARALDRVVDEGMVRAGSRPAAAGRAGG
jgi:glutamate-1-semialdehyde 2,1-aminomutase